MGDCYVAVCGLPHPNKKHALVMARFARDVSRRMNEMARKLEKDLGPGTGNLCMRIGKWQQKSMNSDYSPLSSCCLVGIVSHS